MIRELSRLNDNELECLARAPMLVAILVAGADNEIDRKELRKAMDISRKKSTAESTEFTSWFSEITADFEDKLKVLLQSYPASASLRNPLITGELTQLNEILAKVDKRFGNAFYVSLRNVARAIAQSSGGVAREESTVVELPMIKDPG